MFNLEAILTANGVGAVLMIILLISSRMHTRSIFLDEKIFVLMVWLTLSLCVTEAASFAIDGRMFPGSRLLNRLLNVILFTANLGFSFIWTVYVDYKVYGDRNRLRKRYVWIGLPAAITMAMSVLNLFTDVFFTISADNVYSRLPLVTLTYVVTYAYLFYGAGLAYRKKFQGRKYLFMPMMIFMAPVIIGSLCQFLFYGVSLVWVSVAISMVSLYMNIQNEDAYVDVLTGLYNRLYLTRHLRDVRPGKGQQLAGIMLDIDAFKTINDTYGHATGDQALQDMGKLLYRVAMDYQAMAVRFGGDEFILLRTVAKLEEMLQVGEALRKAVNNFNAKKHRPYALTFSMGTTVFQGERQSLDDFLRNMDAAMYQSKRDRSHAEVLAGMEHGNACSYGCNGDF